MSDQLNLPACYVTPFKDELKAINAWSNHDKSSWSVDSDKLAKVLSLDQVVKAKRLALDDVKKQVPGSSSAYRAFNDLEKRVKTRIQIEESRGTAYDPSAITVHLLKDLPDAMKDAVKRTSKRRWIYVKLRGTFVTPFYVKNISYTPRSRHREEYVSLSLIAMAGYRTLKTCSYELSIGPGVLRQSAGVTFQPDFSDSGDGDDGDGGDGVDGIFEESATRVTREKPKPSRGTMMSDILERKGIMLANDELEAEYERDFAAFVKLSGTCGQQYLPVDAAASGLGVDRDSWYRRATDPLSLTVEGMPSKLIIDDTEVEDYREQLSTATGLSLSKTDGADFNSFWESVEDVVLPTVPVVRVFNLAADDHMFVAASDIKPYEYDETIWDKLVLPDRDLDFIHILLSSTVVNISDIVKGKARGIIVVCSGPPGLGKTLSAEASSEAFKRPFYSVQCSQLGINPEELEKNLTLALTRASRWQAILLLDEADVYVRRRGDDITQNAIVGVFLRVLEYYRGVLFMTTNLGEDIDDAILSRATAHLRYQLPSRDLLPKLWNVLATQLSVDLSEKDVETLVSHFGEIPGRTIRNVLKLTKYCAVARKKKPDAAMVISSTRYLNTPGDERAAP